MKIKLNDGSAADAYRVYGLEECDMNHVSILVEYPLINDRYRMSRDSYKKIMPVENDYLVIDSDGNSEFITNDQFVTLTMPKTVSEVSTTPEEVQKDNEEASPESEEDTEATLVAEPVLNVTSGLSSTDGLPTSSPSESSEDDLQPA